MTLQNTTGHLQSITQRSVLFWQRKEDQQHIGHRRHGLLLLQRKELLLQETIIRQEIKMCGLKPQLVLNGLTKTSVYVHTDTGNPIEGLVNCLVVNFALFGHDLCS